MNLAQLFSGCLKALGKDASWPESFDLTRSGFIQSFLALFLSLPFYYICAAAVVKNRTIVTGTASSIPAGEFFGLLLLFGLTFPLCAFALSNLFNGREQFQPWVIVRHWTMFFAALILAALFGLTMAGLLPFMFVMSLAFIIYMGALAMDIRLAQKIAGFDWGIAIFAGCIPTALGLLIILFGVSQNI